MPKPQEVLSKLLACVLKAPSKPAVKNRKILARIEYVSRCPSNRAGVRLLMACMLAKIDRPAVDPRKPYTEISGKNSFSGRTYDEQHLTHFINANQLPCNPTTGFLTPAFRNIDKPLSTTVAIIGRPPQVYRDTVQILEDVAKGRVSAKDVLTDAIRLLVAVREEKKARMATLLASLQYNKGAIPLSSEAVVKLIEQHLACKHSSRLPVLVVAAAYRAAADKLGERVLPLQAHTAADEQTGALGDVEICLMNDDRVVTIYEMKSKRVTIDDMDRALQKIAERKPRIDNYVFITTDVIHDEVKAYAAAMYEKTNGTEIVVLDCIGFARHFLHLFHRLRIQFLDSYQLLLLAESDSAVSQPLKEAFLSLRQAAESSE
ncbi:MAG: restriction endonuclease, SacI family [Candidatus Omnitrophica bacterium]|nr:restriction endonuclease, SacI family [Candidatus Omnitrophota bacterium]